MIKYVALLRGIGPTNPNMKSEKLKGLFEELGFSNVQTVIASGNVIFESNLADSTKIAEKIEKALPIKLGFSSNVVIRSQDQLQEVYDQHPYKNEEHNQKTYLLITFFKKVPNNLTKMPKVPSNKPYKLLQKDDGVIYGLVDLTRGKTPDYMAWLEKQFGKDITSRTLKTIERILAKMTGS